MINELIFLSSIIFIIATLSVSARMGKETLIAFITVQWIFANILVTTQITLFGMTATAADPLVVGALLGFSLLQEHYGKALARISIWAGFLSLLFMTGITALYNYYTPIPEDLFYTHCAALFAPALRITLASAAAYLITQYFDYILFGFLKERWPKSPFLIRSYSTLLCAQLIDTVLFSFLGLYGIISNIWSVIAISYLIKVLTLIASGPFIAFTQHYLAVKKENAR